MSTENYRGYKLRYVKDRASKGKIKVYVPEGTSSKTRHLIRGNPPYICFKKQHKPSKYWQARSLAHRWVDMNRR